MSLYCKAQQLQLHHISEEEALPQIRIYTVFLSHAHCQILKMVLCDCFTDLILLRVTLNFLIHEKELLKPFIQP